MHGFTDIVFIGDSGGNQRGQDNVAAALSTRWAGEATVLHVPDYYRAVDAPDVLRDLGVTHADMPADGLHDNPAITLNMMLDDPRSVRWAERVATRQASIDGVSIADLGRSLELAQAVAGARATRTADIIRARIAGRSQ